MNNLSNRQEVKYLETEIWGVLNFELNLPALYHILSLDKLGIGYIRFFYMVIFPNEVPIDLREQILGLLANRKLLPWYDNYINYPMTDEEAFYHHLAIELLRLKHIDQIHPERFEYIYQLPMNRFYHISLKMIENKFLTSQIMFQIYHNWRKKR